MSLYCPAYGNIVLNSLAVSCKWEESRMKRPDLLVLIAVWEFLTALGALAGVTAIAVFAIPAVWDYPPAMFGLSMAVWCF